MGDHACHRRLPNRREHKLVDFDHAGFHYVAGLGRFEDGHLAEIFLNVGKSDTPIETQARDATIVASIGLQHAATVETFRHAVTRNGDGSASGPLGALLDLLAVSP